MKKFMCFIICLFTLTACNIDSKQETLTEAELAWFQTEFFAEGSIVDESAIRLAFLNCAYEKPEGIDLEELFYDSFGATISDEEYALLEVQGANTNLDIIKVTADYMNAVLIEYTGLGLGDTEKKGLDKFYHISEYDAYYLVHSDTHHNQCQVISGFRNDAGDIVLTYRLNSYSFSELNEEELNILPVHRVTLRANGDSYHFLSNQKDIQ